MGGKEEGREEGKKRGRKGGRNRGRKGGNDRRDIGTRGVGGRREKKIEIDLAKDNLAILWNSLGEMEAGRTAKRFK